MREFIDIIVESEVPSAPPAPKIVNGRLELLPAHLRYIRRIRHYIRDGEKLGGQCGWVTEDLQNQWDWDRQWGTYTDRNGDPMIDHSWNFIMPQGIIVDPTADQTGEGHDIRVVYPNDPDYKRYRLSFDDDYNPDLPEYTGAWPYGDHPHEGLTKWDGEFDWDKSDRLRAERGDEWWVSNPRHRARYNQKVKRFYEGLIAESRDAYLFHGTSLAGALGIVHDNCINTAKQYEHNPEGVSLAREYVQARDFGTYWDRAFPVVFVLDQQALVRSKLKVAPYRDSGTPGEYRERESEELVNGPISPLSKYLVSINIDPRHIEQALRAKSYYDATVEEMWEVPAFMDTKEKFDAAILAFAKHPLLNAWVPRVQYKAGTKDHGSWPQSDLNEGIVDTLGRAESPVLKNPSRAEVKRLLAHMSKEEFFRFDGEMRALLDPKTQDVYVWDAYYGCHGALKDRYELPKAFHLIIKDGQVQILQKWRYDDYSEEEVDKLVWSNPCLSKLISAPSAIAEASEGYLPATPENIQRAKDFVLRKWQERYVERNGDAGTPPADLSMSCKFTSQFAQMVFGGTIRGNYDHQFVVVEDGTIIDLNIDAEDVRRLGNRAHEHDASWFGNRDHKASMRSCLPRVKQWVEEFRRSTQLAESMEVVEGSRFWKNPTRGQIISFVKEKYEIRMLSDGRDVFAFTDDLTHAQARMKLGISGNPALCWYVTHQGDPFWGAAPSHKMEPIPGTPFMLAWSQATQRNEGMVPMELPWVKKITSNP